MAKRPQVPAAPKLHKTSVRDFSGGWNIIDNELNLDPKYSVVFDNVYRFADGSVAPRYGNKLFTDFRKGVVTNGSQSITVATINNNTKVTINWTAHPFASGDHVTWSDFPAAVNGIPAADLNRTHGVVSVNANSFTFHVRTVATSTATTGSVTRAWVRDTHVLAGDTIFGIYFQDFLIVVDSFGEIAKVSAAGVATRIFDWSKSNAITGNPAPWRWCTFVSADTFKSKLILANGVDKPLQLDTLAAVQVIFLVDPATGVNTFVPVARIVKSHTGYMTMVTDTEPSILRISAKAVSSVFTGNPAPDDAVDIDLTMITSAINPRVTALASFRDKLFAAFQDNSMLAQLGIYEGALHEPSFSDVITRHGTFSNRTVVTLGNDIFMADNAGVPSMALSAVSGAFTPERISFLIEPAIQKNIARLPDAVVSTQAFSLWSPRERQYWLFLPKYVDGDVRAAPADPIYTTQDMVGDTYVLVRLLAHGLDEGDTVTVAGVTGTIGGVAATDINGDREVLYVVGSDFFFMRVGAAVTLSGEQGGGASATITPLNDETIAYVFAYNPQLRVKAWSRFRDMKFRWGATSLYGRLFFGYQGKIFKYGSGDEPIHSDKVGDYDNHTWVNSTGYAVDQRVQDGAEVYKALVAHTSAGAGTFAADRTATPGRWELYLGEPISFAWELPWADFDSRLTTKSIRHIGFDTKGTAKFSLHIFVDSIYRSPLTLARTPVRSMDFVGSEAGGFGLGTQPFGGGRRTRAELLWGMPIRAKLLKLRFEGTTTEPIRIIAVNFTYHIGSVHR